MNNNQTGRHVLNEISGELIKNQKKQILASERQRLKQQHNKKNSLFKRSLIAVLWVVEIAALVLAIVYAQQIFHFVKEVLGK